ncbi:pentapeptide repeat-containing protein [Streptomyces sp. NPDC093225]|uniref:pentapeptide repeat-containing protein n=1 Tax=Streptomyces sp. NPDC093225 TaxID=3366034 RepID=UPI0038297B0F
MATTLPSLTALAALVFTWMSVQQNNQQLRIAEQGQITTRFNEAVSHLGSSSPDVRFGGIYALERIMHDSAPDQPRVISVLSAFVRTWSQAPARRPAQQPGATPHPPADVVAAITVLAARAVDRNRDGTAQLDFAGADLRGLELRPGVSYTQRFSGKPYRPSEVNLSYADLDGADLRGAELSYVELEEAWLTRANLSGAWLYVLGLRGAVLDGANLANVVLTRSSLYGASLKKANLKGANLHSTAIGAAYLDDADLSHAVLSDADLTDANLPGTNLQGSDVTVDQVISALPHSSTRLPEALAKDPRVRRRIAEVEEGQLLPSPTTE